LQTMMGAKTAEKIREDFDLEVFDEELNECLEEMGMNEATKQKAADLFFDAVEARLLESDGSFRQNIQRLLDAYTPPNPFISNEQLNACELLVNRINELQDHIDCIKSESYELANEILAMENLKAETTQSAIDGSNRTTLFMTAGCRWLQRDGTPPGAWRSRLQ
jgi:hypothetical protein